jgi:molybdenum cofactor synthesis domain-containing protein
MLGPGQIFDVNRFTLTAIVESNGGVADARAPVEDAVDALGSALDACAASDIIVFSGGSSVGERDLIVDVVAKRGEMVFHGIAVKPGKPTGFAHIGPHRTPFFAMPGNPTSCLSNAYVLLAPFLRATARLPEAPGRTITVALGRRIVSQAGRLQFYTVTVQQGLAMPAFKGSGEITSLSHADGFIQIPADRDVVEEGEAVEVTLF